jgi:GT2 family glycosyltransferase
MNAVQSESHQWRLTLNDLGLTPGWYRLCLLINGENGLVGARIRFAETRLPELRMRLENTGGRHFAKTLKVSQPIDSLTVTVDGVAANGVSRIEIEPLSPVAVAAFILKKSIRYLAAMRHRPDPRLAFRKLKAAIRPSASFAFQAHYEQKDGKAAYAIWRTIHEDPHAGAHAAKKLEAALKGATLRVVLLFADGFDEQKKAEEIRQTLTGSSIALTTADVSSFSGNTEPCFVLPIDHDGIFSLGAIERLALALLSDPDVVAVYGDSDLLDSNGNRVEPRLKPVWDKELMWCTDYIRAPLMVRWRAEFADALKLPAADQKPGYAIAVTAIELCERKHLGHIAEILFHEAPTSAPKPEIDIQILDGYLKAADRLSSTALRHDGILCVDWPVDRVPRVSIIIPSKDNPGLLRNCIESIRAKTIGIKPEIVVADNGSVRPDTKAYLSQIAANGAAKVISCPGPFNFSKINNEARRHATGDVFVLLNDDTQVISPHWLVELAGLALRPDVGAIGGLLLYPDGTIQHGGVLLGIGGATADHAFRYMPGDSRGYIDLLRCRREICAVTGACLAVSAEHFDLIGGLDESLPVTLNDIDFCLRLRARGLVNIWTPWAVLEHWESKSRGIDYTESALMRQANEVRIFSERWGELLTRDPTYNPGLNDNAPDYQLAI